MVGKIYVFMNIRVYLTWWQFPGFDDWNVATLLMYNASFVSVLSVLAGAYAHFYRSFHFTIQQSNAPGNLLDDILRFLC